MKKNVSYKGISISFEMTKTTSLKVARIVFVHEKFVCQNAKGCFDQEFTIYYESGTCRQEKYRTRNTHVTFGIAML